MTEASAAPANEHRGEVEIELGGRNYVLRPSFEAIVAIEKLTGNSLIKLGALAGDANLPLEMAAIIICELIRAEGRRTRDAILTAFKPHPVGELLMSSRGGMMFLQQRLEMLIGIIALGGYNAQGERVAAAENAKSEAAGDAEAISKMETAIAA